MSIQWLEKEEMIRLAPSYIRPVNVVLDIGPGIRPQQFFTPYLYLCFEPFKEYIDLLKHQLDGSNAIIVEGVAQELIKNLPGRSVDSIFMIDVLEHLEKENGKLLLKECERVARQQIVIFTPLGYLEQAYEEGDKDGWNLNGVSWQEHRSGWELEDFAPDWIILACRDYHTHNGKGEIIDPPQGAFYAIKNCKYDQPLPCVEQSKIELKGDITTGDLRAILEQIDNRIAEAVATQKLSDGFRLCQKEAELGERTMLLDHRQESLNEQDRKIQQWITDLNARESAGGEERRKLENWEHYLSEKEEELKQGFDRLATREEELKQGSNRLATREEDLKKHWLYRVYEKFYLRREE